MAIGSARRAKENSPAIYRWVWADESVESRRDDRNHARPEPRPNGGVFRPCGTTFRHPAAPACPWWAAKAWLYSTENSEEPLMNADEPLMQKNF